MRVLVAVAVLVACGGKPSPPNPEEYKKLTEEQRCEATASRAESCVGYIMTAQLAAIAGDDELVKEIGHDLKAPTDNDRAAYMQMCRAGFGTADAVVACWKEESCKAFAACVVANEKPPPKQPSPCERALARRTECRAELEAAAAPAPEPGSGKRSVVIDETSIVTPDAKDCPEALVRCIDKPDCAQFAACVHQ
jgi:hypothetical protein